MPQSALPELRLAFAMGGGVSLGVFSGSALGEALKMAVLSTVSFRGVAPRYSRVIVDVFSGASAGSLTLVLMLRALLAPPNLAIPNAEPWLTLNSEADNLGVLGNPWNRLSHAAAVRDFGRAFVDNLKVTFPGAYADLIAAQRVQLVEECAWRDRVTIDLLLGQRHPQGNLPDGIGGLVDRGAVDALGDEALGFTSYDFSARRLLADRVLCACTIGRLTPHVADARGEFGDDAHTRLTLSDGMKSSDHSDVRVFDLRLGEQAARTVEFSLTDPARWVRAREGDVIPGYVDSLMSPGFWRKLRATAVASGCVPFAFEPVVLERRWYELPPDAEGDVTWPNPAAPRDPRLKRFDVCYDGGTFNNEPIREAFRLASFRDSLDADVPFVRRVVFVDPNALENTKSKRSAVLELHRRDPDAGSRTASTGDRLLAFIGPMINAVWGQARVVEGTKIAATRKRFIERDRMRANIARLASPAGAASAAQAWAIAQELALRLSTQRRTQLMPPGGLDLQLEMRRVIYEEKAIFPNISAVSIDDYPTHLAAWETTPWRSEWALALQFVELDEVMDLIGKHSQAKLVGVAPIDPTSVPLTPPALHQLKPFELLGSPLFAFGGFCSPLARATDARMGKACARYLISLDKAPDGMGHAAAAMHPEGGPGAGGAPDLWPIVDRSLRERVKQEIAAKLPRFKGRLKAVAASSSLVADAGFISRNVIEIIIDRVVDGAMKLGPPAPAHIQFLIRLPGPGYTVVQPGFARDDASVFEAPTWCLRTFAVSQPKADNREWEGPHVKGNPERFVISPPGSGADIQVPLPNIAGLLQDEYEAWECELLACHTCVRYECVVGANGSVTSWSREGTNIPDDSDVMV